MKKQDSRLDKIRRYFEISEKEDIPEPEKGLFRKEEVFQRIENTIAKSRKTARLIRLWSYSASAALVLCVLSFFGYQHFSKQQVPQQLAYEVLDAPKGSIRKIKLPDGTLVWLNAGSKLYFPATFSGPRREVKLEGEAYFEVHHDKAHPFIVHAENLVTQVLGTRFNVRSYAENSYISVSVVSGKVAVYKNPDKTKQERSESLMLTANQEATFTRKSGLLAYKPAKLKLPDASAWKEGKLAFKNASLLEVVRGLERKYNIALDLDPSITGCLVTVNFDNEPLARVLKVLPRLVDGQITYKNNRYLLGGKGCN